MKNQIKSSNDVNDSSGLKLHKKKIQSKIKELLRRKESWANEYSTLNPILEDRLSQLAEELAKVEIELGKKISKLAKGLLLNKIATLKSQKQLIEKECVVLNKHKNSSLKPYQVGLEFYLKQKRADIELLSQTAKDLEKKLVEGELLAHAA